jgi:CTP synthase (UTP-ammonia lyase)
VRLNWVEAERSNARAVRRRSKARTASSCPGGFGSRGTRGMMKAAEYARMHAVPFFGICYGFQWATVEYARNVCGLEGADSTEVDENAPHKVIYKLRDLLGVDELGRTMRLGQLRVRAWLRLTRRTYLWLGTDSRAPSPPLRIQLPLRGTAGRTGHAGVRPLAERTVRRDR